MKLLRFSAIYVILLMTLLGLASCDTTRRASRRIRNIVNEHPELLSYDTVRIDTVITAALPADSAAFCIEDFFTADSNACTLQPTDIITQKTAQGTFVIERLPARNGYRIIYQPDTLQIRARATYTVPKLTIEQEQKTSLAEVIKWLVIGIIVILFARLLLMKVK